MQHNLTPILDFLKKEDKFLVAGHFAPDGDAIGATVAAGFLLQRLGKRFVLYNESGLPERFQWLELPAPICSELPQSIPTNVIIVDSGDAYRVGEALESHLQQCRVLNIDHHLGNPEFGELNWVDPGRSSVGEMIGELALELGFSLDGGLGAAVYLALVTDSGYFSYGNTRPRTMEMAAEILRCGLDPGTFNALVKNQRTANQLRLHALALQELRMHSQGRIAVVSVSQKMFKQTHTDSSACEDLVSSVLQIKGVLAALSLREEQDGQTKFSLRSFGNTDIRTTASHFGGGGHRNAAGGKMAASLQQAEDMIVRHLQQALFHKEIVD